MILDIEKVVKDAFEKQMKKCELNIGMTLEQAVEKQIPKKPEYEADGYADGVLAYDYAKCPVCGRDFECDINDWGCNYCADCGQKLDWSDTE